MDTNQILIADDQYLRLLGLRSLLSECDGLEIVAEVHNETSILQEAYKASLILLNLELLEFQTEQIVLNLKSEYPDKKIILLTNFKNVSLLITARKLKPHGLLSTCSILPEYKTCMEEVIRGNYYEDPSIKSFLEKNQEEIEYVSHLLNNLDSLTRTEKKVLKQLTMNLNNSEISRTLNKSPKTIENHRTNISRKLDISGYNSLTYVALKFKDLITDLSYDPH
ncbi:LuxR C-terminal-related transcriptional regulator [Robertkochia solimangrovi]|uniref:LuxR C-terminal-related transcriptional regulator n=1 Tax=Robertkochia solimangrovi TaxID=2213046 RepID=UPI00117D0995|nr:LuxR C-terminal-related transcriptional regulator [Robertkochia solimangrovi]TRZ45041.1 hypothetical protein DMZ48_04575 [Robertkochia solimangrovi]